MRELKLTKDKFALVDNEDYHWLSRFNWSAHKPKRSLTYYAQRQNQIINGVQLRPCVPLMHREIMEHHGHKIIGLQIDHEDGNTLNNQKSNLRVCFEQQNHWNVRYRGIKNKFKGVVYNPRKGKLKPFQVYITQNKKQVYVGNFADEIEAACVYDNAARKIFGKFAWLNFPGPGENGLKAGKKCQR